jgi:hypothetical protein
VETGDKIDAGAQKPPAGAVDNTVEKRAAAWDSSGLSDSG